jgi:hypothetical protein
VCVGVYVEEPIGEEDESNAEESKAKESKVEEGPGPNADITPVEFDVKRTKLFKALPDKKPEDMLMDAEKSVPQTAKEIAARCLI